MASIKNLKKDIEYLVEEVLTDCYLSIYFHSDKKDAIIAVMNKAVDLRNSLIERVNKPADKKDAKAVHSHYADIRKDMFAGVDGLFTELSALNK